MRNSACARTKSSKTCDTYPTAFPPRKRKPVGVPTVGLLWTDYAYAYGSY